MPSCSSTESKLSRGVLREILRKMPYFVKEAIRMLDDKIHKESSHVYAMRHNGNDFHISPGRYDVNLANNLNITSFHGEHGVVYFLICVSQLSRLSWAKNVFTWQWFGWLQLGKVRQKVGGHSGFCSPSLDQVRTPSSCHTLPPFRPVHWNLHVTRTLRN